MHRCFLLVFDKTSQIIQTAICTRCFAQVYAQILRFLVKLTLSVLFSQNNFISIKVNGCRGCFVELWPKTANRCFLLVFDKTSQFWQIYICASSNRELSCQIDALCTFFLQKNLNFKQSHSCRRCFVQFSHKTMHRCVMLVFDKQANLGKFTVPIAVLRNFELKRTDVLFHWLFFSALFCQNKPISTEFKVGRRFLSTSQFTQIYSCRIFLEKF